MFMSTQFSQLNYIDYPDNVNILTLTRLIERRGSHLIIVPIPSAPTFYGDILDKNDPNIKDFDFTKARDSYRKLIEDSERMGIHMVSLDAEIDSLKNASEEFFFRRDIHWTPSGAKASAKAVSDYIAKNFTNEYKAMTKSTHELSTIGEQEFGGFGYWLESMCDIKLPYMKYKLWTATDKNLGLLNTVEPQIAIIGDSYGLVKGYDWGFEHFLSAESSLNVENNSIAAGGTRAAPIRYFSIKNTTEKLPRFIVWPFALYAILPSVFEETIPALSECNSPIDLTSSSLSFTLPKLSLEGRFFIRIRDFSAPIGVNVELKFSFENGEFSSKVFERKNAYVDITDSKNYYTILPKSKSNQNPKIIDLNVSLAGSSFELCSLKN
jgi:SGNH hydrolase-like domain, acetyltransferase AlgX